MVDSPEFSRDAERVARRLYNATLELLRSSDDPAANRHVLLEPLSHAVAREKTRFGQDTCAALNAALAAGDYDAALDACATLIELAAANGGEI